MNALTLDQKCDNFWEKVVKTDSCWIWQGNLDKDGYGLHKEIFIDGVRFQRAHRTSYRLIKGSIPDPNVLQLDHLCRNKKCVNPDHLEPVTCKTNINRGINHNRTKTHCPKGHELTKENTYNRPDRIGRCCLECIRERSKNRDKVRDSINNKNWREKNKDKRQKYMNEYNRKLRHKSLLQRLILLIKKVLHL